MGSIFTVCTRSSTTGEDRTDVTDKNRSNNMSDRNIAYSRDEPDLIESLLATYNNDGFIDRLLGCVYGQALGDAYGLSTEFETRANVARTYPDQTRIIPFPDYAPTGHSNRWKRGDWTDDTDQWILILETIIEGDGDVRLFASKLKRWIERGFPELGDYAGMGLGANVEQVVFSHGYLHDPISASRTVWDRGGRKAAPNGAVMRCSAVAFGYHNEPKKVIAQTMSLCETTHSDPRCIASCIAVCLVITHLFRNKVDDHNIESLIRHVQDETIQILGDSFPRDQQEAFLWHTDRMRTLEDLRLDDPQTIGYTYKCLASGFYGLRSKRPFRETLNDLIRHGGDADTNGAVCGTMYGARYGYRALPDQWLRAMPYKKWLDKKIITCLQQMNLIAPTFSNTRF